MVAITLSILGDFFYCSESGFPLSEKWNTSYLTGFLSGVKYGNEQKSI